MIDIRGRMTVEAEAASQRYDLLVRSWRSLYQQALNSSDFGSAQSFTRVENDAYRIARSFLDGEADQIHEAMLEIASEAQTATLKQMSVSGALELSDAALVHLNDAEQYLHGEIATQIERDVMFLMQSLRKSALQVRLSSQSRRVPVRQALMEYKISTSTELQFFFHDRGNQKWPSRKYVRAVWRHNLLHLYNEIVLLTLADHGIDKAVVSHMDPKSEFHGLEVSIATNSALPTYSEIRNEVFHPNSNAIMIHVQEPA